MQTFHIADLSNQAVEERKRYLEFLRVPAMSMGLFHLAAKEEDTQTPHEQDEVYYVLSGKAKLQVNDEVHDVGPGSIFYVEAYAPHKFIDIEDFLQILVFFAPAES